LHVRVAGPQEAVCSNDRESHRAWWLSPTCAASRPSLGARKSPVCVAMKSAPSVGFTPRPWT
jgi:hypothetical protein